MTLNSDFDSCANEQLSQQALLLSERAIRSEEASDLFSLTVRYVSVRKCKRIEQESVELEFDGGSGSSIKHAFMAAVIIFVRRPG